MHVVLWHRGNLELSTTSGKPRALKAELYGKWNLRKCTTMECNPIFDLYHKGILKRPSLLS